MSIAAGRFGGPATDAPSGSGHVSMPSVDGARAGNRTARPAVSARMDTIRRPGRLGVALSTLALALAACSAGGSAGASTPPSATPPPSETPASEAPASAPPSDGGTEPSLDPGIGAKPVVPRPGQLDVHQVPADLLTGRADGNTVTVTAVWTSGVEPCNILDHVEVIKGDGTLSIALFEGRGPGDNVCIAIAEQHMTEIEVPDLAAGTWTILDATGNAPPAEVTVG
jgi:hypothetical protein